MIVISVTLLFLALAASPALLSSLHYSPEVSASFSIIVNNFRVILFLTGILTFRLRNRWNSPKSIPLFFGMLALWFLVEAVSYSVFFILLSPSSRDRAFHSLKLDSLVGEEPLFVPYLWSNYRPNPKSKKVNAYGWRWGGGPKKRVLRILCMGGSTTWSDSVEHAKESYPAQLEKFLIERGYDVEVINAGVPYFTSAEVLGLFTSRGVKEHPDIVLFHTGENDVEPLLSPRPYESDYSHWRNAEAFEMSHNELFALAWRIPSWTVRLLAFLKLNPDGEVRHSVARQLTQSEEAIFASNPVENREPLGLKNNFKSLLGVARAHSIDPVTVLFKLKAANSPLFRKGSGHSDEAIQAGILRLERGMAKDNAIMREISLENKVPIIPFDTFETSSPSYWTDHCHLNAKGEVEKARFIGEWLIQNKLVDRAYLMGVG